MKMKVSQLWTLAICLGLTACGGEEPISWARSDRQLVKGSPELARQSRCTRSAIPPTVP